MMTELEIFNSSVFDEAKGLDRLTCFVLALYDEYVSVIILKSVTNLGEMIPGTLERTIVNQTTFYPQGELWITFLELTVFSAIYDGILIYPSE